MLGRPRGSQRDAVIDAVVELTDLSREAARAALTNNARLLDSVPAEQAVAAVERINAAGGEAHVELGWVERYGYQADDPRRGLQICERVAIFDHCLTLTRGILSEDAIPETLLEGVKIDALLAGFDEQRERWAARGLSEASDETDLLAKLGEAHPQFDAQLRDASEAQLEAIATVYADWLQSRGDPRGQLTVPGADTSEGARRRFDAALHAVAAHVLGSFWLELDDAQLRWLGPVIIAARLGPRYRRPQPERRVSRDRVCLTGLVGERLDEAEPGHHGPPPRQFPRPILRPTLRKIPAREPQREARDFDLLRSFLALPASAAVRELELAGRFIDAPSIGRILAEAPCAPGLRRLELATPRCLELCGSAFARLEALALRGLQGPLRVDGPLAQLRTLELELEFPVLDLSETLDRIEAPKLESLGLTLIRREHTDVHRLARSLAASLGHERLAGLRTLTLGLVGEAETLSGPIAQALVDAPQRETLERLDLRAVLDPDARAWLEQGFGARLRILGGAGTSG